MTGAEEEKEVREQEEENGMEGVEKESSSFLWSHFLLAWEFCNLFV